MQEGLKRGVVDEDDYNSESEDRERAALLKEEKAETEGLSKYRGLAAMTLK